jgi:hypothetical protein
MQFTTRISSNFIQYHTKELSYYVIREVQELRPKYVVICLYDEGGKRFYVFEYDEFLAQLSLDDTNSSATLQQSLML